MQLTNLRLLILLVNFHTPVVWEKFIGRNFHVKKFRVEIFSSSWVPDENFLTVNNYFIEVLPLVSLLGLV